LPRSRAKAAVNSPGPYFLILDFAVGCKIQVIFTQQSLAVSQPGLLGLNSFKCNPNLHTQISNIFAIPILFMRKVSFLLILSLISHWVNAQIIIDNTANAQQLAQMLAGNGVRISNAVLTNRDGASGRFFRNGSSILLDSGIVLTTGQVLSTNDIIGIDGFASSLANNINVTRGDADLDNIVNTPTFDACILEFDIIPNGDSINFRYIFCSEEYPDYNCTEFNDAFAFLISGPGITGKKNIALIPGTQIPVAINSVNNGIPGIIGGGAIDNCSSMGPGSPFVNFYVDNSASRTITANGFTVIFTAKAAVQACQTYHIKLTIADVFDRVFDSGVFLEAGSFNSSSPALVSLFPQDNNGVNYLAEGCNTGGYKVRLPAIRQTNTVVALQYNGIAAYGTDYNAAPLTVTIPAGQLEATVTMNPLVDNIAEGNEPATVYILSECGNQLIFDSINFEIRDYDKLDILPINPTFCAGGSVQLQAMGTFTSYNWTPPATLSNPSVANPVASPAGNITYYAATQLGNCYAKDSVLVRLKRIDSPERMHIICQNGNNGFIHLTGNSTLAYPLQFSINGAPFQSDSNFNNLSAGSYIVSVKDATGCRIDSSITLVQAYPNLTAAITTDKANCNGNNGTITALPAGGFPPYQFSLDGVNYRSNNVLTVNAGSYTLYIQDANGCITTRPVVVGADPPVTVATTISPASCSGNADGSVIVTASGGTGVYQYALNNNPFQSIGTLAGTPGPQTVRVQDNNGCLASANIIIPLNNTVMVNSRTDTAICEGTTVTLSTTSNAALFNWTPPATLNNPSVANPVASPAVTTKYFVTVTSGICSQTDSVTITVLPAPVAQAGPDTAVCSGTAALLRASGGVGYLWMPPNYLSNSNIANPRASPPASLQYRVRVKDILGCNSLKEDTMLVTIVPLIGAYAGRDTIVAINQPLQLQASGSINYLWQPATGLSSPFIPNPVAVLTDDIVYTVTVSDAVGCRGTAKIKVKVYKGPAIYVPNAFTPNGDGLNDALKAIVIGFKSFDHFTVFNRWGQQVFSTGNAANSWDGSFKGLLQNSGTFVWVARGTDYTGKIVELRGTTILIR
jgi:gliding motility-associated-like protein